MCVCLGGHSNLTNKNFRPQNVFKTLELSYYELSEDTQIFNGKQVYIKMHCPTLPFEA